MKSQNGITLVALIITIIVLLILATVSISLVINNGVLDKAQHGVDRYSEEEELEQIKLAVASAMLKGNGFLETENLNAELQDRFQKGAEQIGDSKRWSLKLDKNYTIYENGNVEENESLLPAEYQQVQYIESSGTQWIDTKFIPQSTKKYKYIADFQLMDFSKAKQTVMGNDTGDIVIFNNGYFCGDQTKLYIGKTRHKITVEVYKSNSSVKRTIKLDDMEYSTDGTWWVDDPITIFINLADRKRISKVKLYQANVINDECIIRDFIPCYSTTTVTNVDNVQVPANTKGLYDLVEGKFYTNQGTGTFGYGMEDGTYVAPTNN